MKLDRLLIPTAVISGGAFAQQFGFINFPKNLTLHQGESLPISWENQDTYVNISLAQFYYYGGGSESHGYVTTFNTASSLTWTADDSLQQGTYAFFISTLNRNSSESPFFTIISTTVTSLVSSVTTTVSASAHPSSSSLSEAAKVGIGLGIPFGLTLVIYAAYFIWSKRFRQPGVGATPSGYGGSSAVAIQQQRQPVELGTDVSVRELPENSHQ